MSSKFVWTLFGIALFLLSACASTDLPTANPSKIAKPDYLLTVDVKNINVLEQTYGVKSVFVRPDDGYAVLGFSEEEAKQLSASLNTQGATNLEPNKDVFWGGGNLAWMNGSVSVWAGGSVSAWAGGSVSAWAGGMVSAWAGGEYVPLPQNTNKWQSLRLQEAHGLASNLGEGITVAVLDSGIDLKHVAFKGGLVRSKDRWDFVDNDRIPQERGELGQGAYGHGTNVASIVLQIAPKAKIMPLRVLKPNGSGDALDIAEAIHFAIDNGADIINLSLGSEEPSKAVSRAIKAATDKGIFVVSSSGNAGLSTITFPARVAKANTMLGKFSISVGSVKANDDKSNFSNYGEELEIVAPGERVFGPVPGNRLGAWSGTSMAAPMISGALALALAEDYRVDVSRFSYFLEDETVDIYSSNKNQAYKDLLGEGRLDIAEFLEDLQKSP